MSDSLLNLLKTIWEALYNPQSDTIVTIKKFFHPDFEQCINGVVMQRDEYINHVLEQKKNITIIKINYVRVMEKGSELFAIYYPIGNNLNNLPIEAEVIAYFQFENMQIIKIHGAVRLIKGNLTDADMHC